MRVEAEIGKILFVRNPERAVVDVKERLKKLNFRLGAGEIECVVLCMETNYKVLFTDDDDAKRFARTYGKHTLTITMKLDEYNIVTQSKEYQVRAFNPVVTELSPDLREENGIRGTVTIGSS